MGAEDHGTARISKHIAAAIPPSDALQTRATTPLPDQSFTGVAFSEALPSFT
jgi:hypothetical protein